MANPINSFTGGVQPLKPGSSAKPAGEAAPAAPKDSFSVTTSYSFSPSLTAQPQYTLTTPAKAPAPEPEAPKKATLSLRLEVDAKLLEPDPVTGELPISKLEPDFVPHDARSSNAPVVLAAITDPEVPDGWVPKTAVALVPKQLDTPDLEQTHRPAMVANDAYIMSPAEAQNYAESYRQHGFAEGKQAGFEEGHKAALPPGFQAKVMDSPEGKKLEDTAARYTAMGTMIGSSSAALGMAHNIGIPAHYAALLGPAVAGLQIFGPTGSLATMSKIENNRAALIAAVRADHPGEDISKVAIDVNPATQTEVSLEDAMKNLDGQKTVQKMKLVTAVMLAGAGVATVAGMAPLAAGLAIGSMANPVLDQFPSLTQLGAMRERKAELKQLQADGKTQVEVHVPVFGADGSPAGVQAKQVPIEEAIKNITTQQKNVALAITQSVAGVGAMAAMGLGAPVMLAIGVSVGAPLLARAALFPGETWDTLKSIPEKVWNGIKALARVLHLYSPKKGTGADGSSEAADKLLGTAARIGQLDPDLAARLQETFQARLQAQDPKQAAALSAQHDALLGQLAQKSPELAQEWAAGMTALTSGKAGELRSPQMTPAQQELDSTFAAIGSANKELGRGLEATLSVLSAPPRNEAEQQAVLEAAERHEKLLGQLQKDHPELATRFHESIGAVTQEARETQEAAQFEQTNEQIEQAVESDFARSLLASDRVKQASGGDQMLGESVVRMMAQAQLFGSDEVFQTMISSAETDKDAARQLKVFRALEAELAARSAAQQSPAA